MYKVSAVIIVISLYFIMLTTPSNIRRVEVNTEAESYTIPSIKLTPNELKCLAENMYYEARGEGKLGVILVANVTLNRAKSAYYPQNVCSVVYQKAQFSWTLNKKLAKIPKPEMAYFMALAKNITEGTMKIPRKFKDATHYYSNTINTPKWGYKLEYVGYDQHHLFFKDPKVTAENRVSYMK